VTAAGKACMAVLLAGLVTSGAGAAAGSPQPAPGANKEKE